MPKAWLILDCSYLCSRALHTMGELSYKDVKTGVIYGFFKDVAHLMDVFASDTVVFCFDAKGSKRKEIFPDYKVKRHNRELDENEKLMRFELHRQIEKLRTEYLRTVGYRNVFWEDGFEADDIIATTAAQVPWDQQAVIVSADRDFYQLLRHNVTMFNPDKVITHTVDSFKLKWGISPKHWAWKLALAGCKTDEVPGIDGIGDKRAIDYIKGELKPTSKAYAAITSPQGKAVVARNKPLVKLPFAGTPVFEIRPDKVTDEGWRVVMEALGMNSLKDRAPLGGRQARRQRATFGL